MKEYLEMPWSIEDTIENLKEIKEYMQKKVLSINSHGKGEKDAKEIAFDFDRAIEALEKQNPKDVLIGKAFKDSEDNTVFICPKCKHIIEGISFYCWNCGQKIKWE